MRVLLILPSLALIALLVFMMVQHKGLVSLNNESAKLKTQSEEVDFQYTSEDFRKATMEKLVAVGNKLVKELEGMVAKLLLEFEKKKTENDACQAEKKMKEDELAGMQNEHNKIKDASKKESDAWKQEIDTLTAQLFGHTEICDYVNNTLAVKLCVREQVDPTHKQELGGNKP